MSTAGRRADVLAAIVGRRRGVLVCIHYDWWPSRFGDARWADPLLFGGAAILVLIARVWCGRFPHLVTSWVGTGAVLVGPGCARDRDRSRVACARLFPPPSFDDLRPDFEGFALEVLASPDPSRQDVEIGRFDFHYVRKDAGGAVYFVDAAVSESRRVPGGPIRRTGHRRDSTTSPRRTWSDPGTNSPLPCGPDRGTRAVPDSARHRARTWVVFAA
ncbi:hypothetical protein GS498_17820 [Rhodococcus hoagii]|nr:hypothetical protein [Prescottella equi]